MSSLCVYTCNLLPPPLPQPLLIADYSQTLKYTRLSPSRAPSLCTHAWGLWGEVGNVRVKQSTEEDSYIRSKRIASALLSACVYARIHVCVCVCVHSNVGSIRIIAREKRRGGRGGVYVAVRIGNERRPKRVERLFKKYNPSRGSRMTDSREIFPRGSFNSFLRTRAVIGFISLSLSLRFDREKSDDFVAIYRTR